MQIGVFIANFTEKQRRRTMIKIENVDIQGFKPAIRGMRHSFLSYDKSDSLFSDNELIEVLDICGNEHEAMEMLKLYDRLDEEEYEKEYFYNFVIGPNDEQLMRKLVKAGASHRKFMRMIVVWCDIIAPLELFKQIDTYKVGTVCNSCSTMHKITAKSFEISDFSFEEVKTPEGALEMQHVIDRLNFLRDQYLHFDSNSNSTTFTKEDIWREIIAFLPESYNQKRTLMLNYEVLRSIYHDRKGHRLKDWATFREWIETLPCSYLITED